MKTLAVPEFFLPEWLLQIKKCRFCSYNKNPHL